MGSLPVISVIDDDEDVRTAIEDLLLSVGYSAAAFASVDDFSRHCKDQTFDCVVSDIQMPGVDGIEFARRMAETEPQTPVILISAFANMECSRRARDAGAFDFLSKPFDPDALLERIEAALAA